MESYTPCPKKSILTDEVEELYKTCLLTKEALEKWLDEIVDDINSKLNLQEEISEHVTNWISKNKPDVRYVQFYLTRYGKDSNINDGLKDKIFDLPFDREKIEKFLGATRCYSTKRLVGELDYCRLVIGFYHSTTLALCISLDKRPAVAEKRQCCVIG